MSELGEKEALQGAEALKKHGYTKFDLGYTSALTRAHQTLDIILKEIGQTELSITKDLALNERDYGALTVSRM